MDNDLSQELDRLKLPIYNVYGNSELGRLLWAPRAPYTHLRPLSSKPLPLVRPISEYSLDGSRYVELWILAATSLHITHHIAHGGVPIKLEPFPGHGPHKDELALNLEDIFQELTIDDGTGSGTETVYVHVGRQTDQLRLGGAGIGHIDASLYEATLESRINSHIGQSGKCPWVLDSVQLFGTNLPCTALVIQLYYNEGAARTLSEDTLKGPPIHELHQLVEETNKVLGLVGRKRVHTERRTLIVGSDGTLVHGPGTEIFDGLCPTLGITHKRTLKRWENVCRFKSWLEGLNFEP
ncbi:hypothetical protein BN14_10173 [Rhizoctonia solani AG-1 IB]|nr:unnamed protein product [Rhizoctonia solani]CCO36051.1 hypothetical protein BN14_10173 [Rhizoctonia solani AG-1 IB]